LLKILYELSEYWTRGDDCYAKLIDSRDTKIIQADIINWITDLKDTEKKKSPASINLYCSSQALL
jgi:hypothetical protein